MLLRIFILLFSLSSFGFIPPLSSILRQAYEDRKPGSVAADFRHAIALSSGDTVEVEELSAQIGGKVYFIFRVKGIGALS